MPKREDGLLLLDIHGAGSKILLFTTGYSFDDYMADERTKDAVVRNFEIIGEAARNLSTVITEANPQVEWKKIIGFRNILVHDYFGIDHRIVWTAIQDFLPDTIKAIQKIIETTKGK
ncbi:HepT-like ribonuclease domain-containing protein [Flavisolibacter ginsenosidimutans]|uniref:DUF86 domain-containing protein n=1 Tax=Flavisolibacter ginsenosidimutans TaxID=661481 RepID=A0A5B8UKM1_9BACT|nr:DUF86 domain-containing protein [Flavisolibacter ginsenosidimutans]QEC57237.1 DUF86 domain-containing protein [Flavisolibacter ginsenosidimutans]